MKIEHVATGGEPIDNINYMFKSANPTSETADNPLQLFNQRIIEIRLIGGIIPESSISLLNI